MMADVPKKFDPTLIWVVLLLTMLQTCDNDSHLRKLESEIETLRTQKVTVNVIPRQEEK